MKYECKYQDECTYFYSFRMSLLQHERDLTFISIVVNQHTVSLSCY